MWNSGATCYDYAMSPSRSRKSLVELYAEPFATSHPWLVTSPASCLCRRLGRAIVRWGLGHHHDMASVRPMDPMIFAVAVLAYMAGGRSEASAQPKTFDH